jgi:hypothetical protein
VAHHGTGGPHEVLAVVPGRAAADGQFELGLVDDSGRVELVAGSLAGKRRMCQSPEFRVDSRDQALLEPWLLPTPLGEGGS